MLLPRIGDTVTWQVGKVTLTGEVRLYRDATSGRVLTVRLADGRYATVQAAKASTAGAAEADVVAQTSLGDADRLARAILDGQRVRLPVNQQLTILALGTLGKETPR